MPIDIVILTIEILPGAPVSLQVQSPYTWIGTLQSCLDAAFELEGLIFGISASCALP